MNAPVCFVDTETTGLDPERHEIWEVGLITPNGRQYHWFLPINEVTADPFALGIGRYWERYSAYATAGTTGGAPVFARVFRALTADLHLAGAVVSFDEERLRRLLLREGFLPRWHYHLVDVEALAAGHLHMPPPWNSNDLSRAVGVNPDDFERHTALGDARWAKAIYDAVMTP